MKQITLDENSIFSIENTNAMGIKKDGVISSHDFVRTQQKVLIAHKGHPEFDYYVYEYAAILKELVKREMIIEMQIRIENLETFYR